MTWVCPLFNPLAFHWGPIRIHWYGIAYVLAFLMAYYWGKNRLQSKRFSALASEDIWMEDVVFYAGLGVLLGGRLGYMLIYAWDVIQQDPFKLFAIWQGGMSFHGGLLGVMIALGWYCHEKKIHYVDLMDFIVPMVPLGIALGRMANFINGELWGRPTGAHWGVIYPWVDDLPRYPSQLIEMTLEGFVMFALLYAFEKKTCRRGQISSVFFISYACLRFIAECFRQPDAQMGYWFGYLTMGQLLSLPMLMAGIWLMNQKRINRQYLYSKISAHLSTKQTSTKASS
jgi:phosphatidylglycerol---prolipoprotein diacylglyceryl transferase